MATVLTLNGISMPAALPWADRHKFSPVAQRSQRTLGGRAVYEPQPLTKGRPITFVSKRDQGWVNYATVQALQAIADVGGGVYVLQLGSESWNVMFRHHEPPAFSAEGLLDRLSPDGTDNYLINMKLITV